MPEYLPWGAVAAAEVAAEVVAAALMAVGEIAVDEDFVSGEGSDAVVDVAGGGGG